MTLYRSLYTSFITFSLIVVSTVSFASDTGAEHHGIAWGELLWPFINFAVLAGILVFFTRKPFREYFKNRTANIEKSIKEATEAKELAEKTLAEVRERLKNTEQETGQIIEAAKRSGEKEKETLIAEGEHMKQKIVEQAKASIGSAPRSPSTSARISSTSGGAKLLKGKQDTTASNCSERSTS